MNVRRSFDLFHKVESDSSATMSDSATMVSSAAVGQSMKASRKRTNTNPRAARSLTSISIASSLTSNLVEYVEPTRHRDEVILSARNVGIFVSLIEEYRHADTFRRHGLPVRSKLLFCGPPGCGKTATAEVFARELGLPLFVARLDAIVSSFLGETATNLRKLFEEADRRPCVLFLDEFDALARTRKDESEHSELRRVVNSLLMLIDRYRGRGFVVAATNLDESLDPAVWRRFDEVIHFDLPKDRQIQQMVELKTRNFPLSFNLRDKLVKLRGLSYADIERVCLSAVKRSVLKHSRTVSEADFNIAIREERRRHAIRAHLTSEVEQ
jgi:SpoVK/Ycf46/Vps4 family AAA+-type ATPase